MNNLKDSIEQLSAGDCEIFAKSFLHGYGQPAFGCRSKSEIDLLVFTCLIEANTINPTSPVYDIARSLNISPTKVRSLLFNWQLRSTPANSDLTNQLAVALQKIRFVKNGTMLSFGIESPLLLEEMRARLKNRGVFAEISISKEILTLPLESFVLFLDDVIREDIKQKVIDNLVRNKQMEIKNFKSLIYGILKNLGSKLAGKVGEEFTDSILTTASEALSPTMMRLMNFIKKLMSQDPDGAAALLVDDDLIA